MKNAEWMIKNGYKFSDVRCGVADNDDVIIISLNGKILGNVLGNSYLEAFAKWLDAKHDPILDDAENGT